MSTVSFMYKLTFYSVLAKFVVFSFYFMDGFAPRAIEATFIAIYCVCVVYIVTNTEACARFSSLTIQM